MNIEVLKIVSDNLKMGHVLSFTEVMLIQQAIDVATRGALPVTLTANELSTILNWMTPPYTVSDTHTDEFNELRNKVFYALRDAQNDEPVSQPYKLPVGWVAVPVEPTEEMIINGFESVPDPHFSDEKEWEEYEALSGCRKAARWAELCWAAMIKAAPKQENI